MVLSADKYLRSRLSDLRIFSPLGFKEEDLLLKAAARVAVVQEGYSKDLFSTSSDYLYRQAGL